MKYQGFAKSFNVIWRGLESHLWQLANGKQQ